MSRSLYNLIKFDQTQVRPIKAIATRCSCHFTRLRPLTFFAHSYVPLLSILAIEGYALAIAF